MAENLEPAKSRGLNIHLWNLLLVVTGGLIGLVGGLGSAMLSHQLGVSESHRAELISAYAAWSGELHNVIEDERNLWFFDYIEKLKKEGFDASIPNSPSGQSRENLVLAASHSQTRLMTTQARLLLLEPVDNLADKIRQISDINRPVEDDPSTVFTYFERKQNELEDLLRDLEKNHPIIAYK